MNIYTLGLSWINLDYTELNRTYALLVLPFLLPVGVSNFPHNDKSPRNRTRTPLVDWRKSVEGAAMV